MKKRLKNKNKFNFIDTPTKRFNLFVVCVCFFLILGLSVGYAILTEQLNLDGTITLRADKDIRVNSITNFSPTNGGYEIYNPRYATNDITTNINLPNLDSTITYTSTIVNKGTVAMKVKSIRADTFSNNSFTYQLSGINKGQVIQSDQTVTFTITFKYKSGISILPNDTTLGSVISFNFEEYIPQTYEYVSNGLLLDLRGTTAPVNNIWYDNVDNLTMSLTNVEYSAINKQYHFLGNSFGTLGEPIIPETGDFTLEAYITTPENFNTSVDEAIVAQVSDSVNDDGRIKLNFKYGTPTANKYQIICFANATSISGPVNYLMKLSPDTSSDYILQLVRTDDKLRLFANGIEVTGQDNFNITNTISQGPFKLGKWNSKDYQYYNGSIYAVRVYNRALNDTELANNRTIDLNTYQLEEETDKTIKEYLLDNYFVSTGSGLYESTITDKYVFKGITVNNFLRFQDSNDLYRIVSLEPDNTMKIVNVSAVNDENHNIAYDVSENRLTETSTYCDGASSEAETINGVVIKKGCNAWNATSSLTAAGSTGNVLNDASVVSFLRDYYNSLPTSIKNQIVNHTFYNGFVSLGSSYNMVLSQVRSSTWTGDVGLLDLADVLEASTNNTNIGTQNTIVTNYLTAYSTTKKFIWLMTPSNSDTWDVFSILNGGIGNRRASRTFQKISSTVTANYYVLPAFFINSNIDANGTGTSNTPFIIPNN